MELGSGYSTRSLKNMRKFYLFQKGQPLDAKLNWTHYVILLSLKNNDEINYYINQIKIRNLSKRELQKIIKSKERFLCFLFSLVNEVKLECAFT